MATSDIHLKLGDIKGESTDDKHKDEIDVTAFNWSVSNAGSMSQGGGGGKGKALFTDIEFVHPVDKASTALWKACSTGEHMGEGTLTAAKSGKGPQDFLVIKMNDIIVTSVSTSGNGGSGSCEVFETVRLQAAKVDFEYKPQKSDGSLDAGSHFKYDIKANKEG
jgi:type VI secretion system secreted protein Hcp